jgi:hypothetical protein
MDRLIEVQQAQACPASLTINVGDVLAFAATGGHVQSGANVLELLGPFLPAIMGDHGEILSPMGGPNAVWFLARRSGRARIDVVTGDPWQTPETTILDITVEP